MYLVKLSLILNILIDIIKNQMRYLKKVFHQVKIQMIIPRRSNDLDDILENVDSDNADYPKPRFVVDYDYFD